MSSVGSWGGGGAAFGLFLALVSTPDKVSVAANEAGKLMVKPIGNDVLKGVPVVVKKSRRGWFLAVGR